MINDRSTLGNTSIYKIDTKSTYSVGKSSTMKLAFGTTGIGNRRNAYYAQNCKTPVMGGNRTMG